MRRFVLLMVAFALVGVSAARAELIVGTEPEGNGGYGVGFSFQPDVNLIIGQAFTLDVPIVAKSITLYLDGDETDGPQGRFTLQVMNAIGDAATDDNILLGRDGTFPAGPLPTGHAPVTFDDLNLALPAGTYYLVVSSDAGMGNGWGNNGPALPSMFGSVGTAYVGIAVGGAVGTYLDLDPGNPNPVNANFRIDAVPEPGSVLLLLTGAALFVGYGVRRRRA